MIDDENTNESIPSQVQIALNTENAGRRSFWTKMIRRTIYHGYSWEKRENIKYLERSPFGMTTMSNIIITIDGPEGSESNVPSYAQVVSLYEDTKYLC